MQDSGSHLAPGQPAFVGGRGVMGQGHFYREQTFLWKRMEMLEGAVHLAWGLWGHSGRGTSTPKGAGHHAQQGGCC